VTTPEVKRCPECGETKPTAKFSPDKSRSDGLLFRCKACNARRQRAYYRANRVAISTRRYGPGRRSTDRQPLNAA
jgi:hypothetical protein